MRIFLLIGILTQSVLASELSNYDKRELVREVAVIIQLDKKKENFKDVLENVDSYPKLQCEADSKTCDNDFSSFVKTLFPYLLVKEQKEGMGSQADLFSKLLINSVNFEKYVSFTNAESAIYKFLKEKLTIEKQLQSCSNLRTRYRGQKPMMDVQVQRVSLSNEKHLESELIDISRRLSFLKEDSNK